MTILVSVFTRARADNELVGLVYSLTERAREDGVPWYQRPALLAVLIVAAAIVLNILFW
jgi:SSS family solute:Na+ symporter